MQGRSATHTVVTETIVAIHLIRWVEQGDGIVDSDAVAEKAQTCLHEKAAVGIGTKGHQLAYFALDMQAPLVDLQGGKTASTANNLTEVVRDAFTKDLQTVDMHLVAQDGVAIGRKQPVGLGFINKTTAHIMADTIQLFGIQSWEMKSVGRLKHGHGNGVFHDVLGHLGSPLQRDAQQQQ